jgi:ATP-dependent DNA ligase
MAHGQLGGVVTFNDRQIELNTTGRTMQQQALLEARSRYNSKIMQGYVAYGQENTAMFKAMKGYEYKPGVLKVWPVMVQHKLDGVRCLTRRINSEVSFCSFTNKTNYNMPHLVNDLQMFFNYLPVGSALDGELYNHDLNFETKSSILRTQKTLHPLYYLIDLWIFDIVLTGEYKMLPFEERYRLLVNAREKYVEDRQEQSRLQFFILHAELISNPEQLDQHLQYSINNGYEGVMIKKVAMAKPNDEKHFTSSLYKEGRSANMYKYKLFNDAEGYIIGVVDSNGTEKGCAMLVVCDASGNQFNVRMATTFEQRQLWLQQPELVLGKLVTYKYQDLTKNGLPRFPIGKSLRDYE